MTPPSPPPVFRFAPSPNGALHLGHAYSALMNQQLARASGGRLLLRIEDIDATRCRPEFDRQILEDLDWLGIEFERPVLRQSEHLADYAAALDQLKAQGLVYPAFLSRGAVKAMIRDAEAAGQDWPRDPDGTPLYPQAERSLDPSEAARRIAAGDKHAWRLDMSKALAALPAPLTFRETGTGRTEILAADPSVWGDVVLSRSDAPSSYHLSVVVDDARQGVTTVVRGRDLFSATSIHRLLQHLLGLPEPTYHHHRLILDDDGGKLSKSRASTGIASLRQQGASPLDIRHLCGFPDWIDRPAGERPADGAQHAVLQQSRVDLGTDDEDQA